MSEFIEEKNVTIDNYSHTEEVIIKATREAEEKIRSTNIPEINLSEEEIKSHGYYVDESSGQEIKGELTHAVVTFLTPAFGQQCPGNTYGLKIYSAHCNEEEAMRYARKLKEYHTELYGYPIYAIMVMEMSKFITIPTTKDELARLRKNREASDDHLNELIRNYRNEQEKSKILFDVRKDTLINSAKRMSVLERAKQLREESATNSTTNSSESTKSSE